MRPTTPLTFIKHGRARSRGRGMIQVGMKDSLVDPEGSEAGLERPEEAARADVPGVLVALREGPVVGSNAAAVDLLGPGGGRRCWDFVAARDAAGGPLCEPGCTAALHEGSDRRADRPASVRGRRVRLTCEAVGDLTVVRLRTAGRGAGSVEALSRREREILLMLAEGQRAPAIASRLGVAVTTVRTHLSRARRKVGARSQAELVALALRSGAVT